MILSEMFAAAALGAVGYGFLEFLWRGYTHWSMLLAGGLCFSLLYFLSGLDTLTIGKKLLLGGLMITTVELLFGILFNLRLGLNIWDYSSRAFNLKGQICALYSLYWFLLCIPALRLCARLRGLLRKLRR
jgi:uncharacterized membrane protein